MSSSVRLLSVLTSVHSSICHWALLSLRPSLHLSVHPSIHLSVLSTVLLIVLLPAHTSPSECVLLSPSVCSCLCQPLSVFSKTMYLFQSRRYVSGSSRLSHLDDHSEPESNGGQRESARQEGRKEGG